MALMFPQAHRASAVAPRTMRRAFRLQLRCADCRKESETDIEMLDEVDDSATEHDFYASGAINRLEYKCDRCSCEAVTILRIGYIQQPIDMLAPDRG